MIDPNSPTDNNRKPPVDGTGIFTPSDAGRTDPPSNQPVSEGTIDLPASSPSLDDDRTDAGDGRGTFDYVPDSPTATHCWEASLGLPVPESRPAFHPTKTGNFSNAATDPDLMIPSLGRYSLKQFHARGGMGEIWIAEDADIGRTVAVKRMRKQVRDHKDSFIWEAQITGQLEHPGVVPVHELGTGTEGEPFYAMKFVHGQTMLEAIQKFHEIPRTDPRREVERVRLLQVFLAVCQTIAYAHSRGVIHRDIKPENVMIGEYGEALVLDWGLAKVVGKGEVVETMSPIRRYQSGDTMETLAGSVKGTAGYMAPESALGDVTAVDHVSDVYLLGGTLYHLLTGQLPRTIKKFSELLTAAKLPPKTPRSVDPSVPKPLEAICLKAMAIEKGDRYPTAIALADDLQRYLAGEPVSAYRETFAERTWRWARRHRTAIGRGAAAVLVIAAAGLGFWMYEEQRQESTEKLRIAEEDKARTEKERAFLEAQAQARRDLAKFRHIADEMNYIVANIHPVDARSPFLNAQAGLAKGRDALAVAVPWGDKLDGFPLPDEKAVLKNDLYGLLLLMAQVRAGDLGEVDAAKESLAFLDRAAHLQTPTRGYRRLRSQALATVGLVEPAKSEAALAVDVKAPTTATDHFLLGEQYRVSTTRADDLQDQNGKFRPNRPALEKAIAEYRLALRSDPDHYWSNNQLGRCLLSLGRGAEAVQTFGTCIALRPDTPWGYSARGMTLTFLHRFDEAQADLDKAIQLDPETRMHRMNRGVLTWQRGNPTDSLADFDAALAPPTHQQLPEAAFYKAQVYGQLGKLKEAREAADLALSLDHPPRTVYMLRAQLHFQLDDVKKGLADLDAYDADGRKNYDSNAMTAFASRGHRLRLIAQEMPASQEKERLQRMRTFLLAESQLNEAIRRGATDPAVYDDYGAVLELLGKTTDAIIYYQRALGQNPPPELKVRILVKRGWAHERLPKPALDKARDDFDAALRIAPNDAEAHTGLGYMQASLKAEAEARREASRAVLVGGGDFLILHNVACIYAKLSEQYANRTREYEDMALDHLRRAVELWNRDRSGPNEIVMILGESAFTKSLRARPEFQELVNDKKR